MEKIMTKDFTSKDLFNASSATPINTIEGQEIEVSAVCIMDKVDGTTVGYLKGVDGKIYATISATVMEQMSALADMVEAEPQKIKVVAKTSNQNRTYYQLELV